jgi:hypothetical protein
MATAVTVRPIVAPAKDVAVASGRSGLKLATADVKLVLRRSTL